MLIIWRQYVEEISQAENKIEDNNELGEKRYWIKQENKVLKRQTPSAL